MAKIFGLSQNTMHTFLPLNSLTVLEALIAEWLMSASITIFDRLSVTAISAISVKKIIISCTLKKVSTQN
jgi:hypothetical protein